MIRQIESAQPVLFIGHGSPMNAIEDNTWSRAWRALGKRLPRAKAILCVSAHWTAPGVRLCSAAHPKTIHDFRGFPPALYDIQYPSPGDPVLAERVAGMLDPALQPTLDAGYGLDHGAWQVLLHLFPDADVPVVQLSLDLRRPGTEHFAIGRMLAPLRDEGVLVLTSGNIVHNLGLVDFNNPIPLAWAAGFRDTVNGLIAAGDFASLADYESLADNRLAIPTPEHYLPLLYALACARSGDALELFNDDVFSSLSMTSLAIGLDTTETE